MQSRMMSLDDCDEALAHLGAPLPIAATRPLTKVSNLSAAL